VRNSFPENNNGIRFGALINMVIIWQAHEKPIVELPLVLDLLERCIRSVLTCWCSDYDCRLALGNQIHDWVSEATRGRPRKRLVIGIRPPNSVNRPRILIILAAGRF
jgi:hypothetical protein